MAYVRAHDTKANARGRIVKRYEVVYRAKVRTDDGRTVTRLRQEAHPTKAAADARAAQLNSRKYRRAVDPSEVRKLGDRSPAEWAGDWLDSQQGRADDGYLTNDTVEGYGKLLNYYVLPELGTAPIASNSVTDIDRFMSRLSARRTRTGSKIHPRTVKHGWHVLSRVFEYATRKEALEVNPIPKTDYADNHQRGKKSAHKIERFKHHPLTIDQVGAVCLALRGEYPGADGKPLPAYRVYAVMVEFMASTGLRASEVAGLEVQDIRFAPQLAGQPVTASVRVERTKKRKGGVWVTGPPKSARSRRTVPLPGWLAGKLADYLASDHPRATESNAPLWPSRSNGGGYRAKGARYAVPLDWSAPAAHGHLSRDGIRTRPGGSRSTGERIGQAGSQARRRHHRVGYRNPGGGSFTRSAPYGCPYLAGFRQGFPQGLRAAWPRRPHRGTDGLLRPDHRESRRIGEHRTEPISATNVLTITNRTA
jgi:integrase